MRAVLKTGFTETTVTKIDTSTSPTALRTSLALAPKPPWSPQTTAPSSKAGTHPGVVPSNSTPSKREQRARTRKSALRRRSEVPRWTSSGAIWCFSRFSRGGVIIRWKRSSSARDGRGWVSVDGELCGRCGRIYANWRMLGSTALLRERRDTRLKMKLN